MDYFSAQNLQTYALVAIVGFVAMAAAMFWRRWRSGAGALLTMVLNNMNNMTQGVVLFDAHERVLVINDRYVEMYGLSWAS